MRGHYHILSLVTTVAHVAHVAHAPTTVEKFALPPDVFVVEDATGRQWTNIAGAAKLAGKSRRTIHEWIFHRWVTVRRTPANRAEILVATLWREPTAADDLTAQPSEVAP